MIILYMFWLVFTGAVARLWLPVLLGLIAFTVVVGAIAAVSGGVFLKAAIIAAIAYVVVALLVLVGRSLGAIFGQW